MLSLKNVSISINNNLVLENLNLEIKKGDVVCILAQNGQGKSSLLKTIMGFKEYAITRGWITFNDHNLTHFTIDQRAHLGIFLANQAPIEIPGVSMLDFLKTIYQQKQQQTNLLQLYRTIEDILKQVHLNSEFLTRSVNENFSGGEKKKSELAQMLLLDPQLIMLDELDSGLDIDTIKLCIKLIKQEIARQKTIVFVSHQAQMINDLKPNKVILIANQKIVKIGGFELAEQVLTQGYKKTLLELGIKEKVPETTDCIGKSFGK